MGVVEVSVVDTHYGVSQPEQTLSGRGARVYTAHRDCQQVCKQFRTVSNGS